MTSTNGTAAPTAGTTPEDTELDELREQLREARHQADVEHDARNSLHDELFVVRDQYMAAQEALGAERTRIASLEDRLDRVRISAWALVILVCLAANALAAVVR